MHRFAAALLAAFSAYAPAAAHAVGKPARAANLSVCETFSEATVRTLTGVATGGFSRKASRSQAGSERCVYGVTDGDLVLDIYYPESDSLAIDKMAKLGAVTNSVNNTESPYGTDQVNEWRHLLSDSPDGQVYDVAGYAARHGSVIVAIGLDRPDSDFSKDGIKRLQAIALTTAGAHLAPWPKVDVCARVPARAIQTLVALGPATVLTTEQKSSAGNSTCEYEVHPLDSDDPVPMRVVLTASQWINDTEALGSLRAKGQAAPSLPTGDPADQILQIDSRKDTAYALHPGFTGEVYVSSAEAAALQQPSYGVHLEEAALLAAGASVPPGPALSGIPAAVAPDWLFTTKHDLGNFFEHYWLLLVFAAIVAWVIRSRYRRHELILHGLPGTALVRSISDTGITINNDPVIRLHVTVTPGNGMPFEATINQTVSRLEAPASWLGRNVQVRIDPKRPQRFVVV